MLQQAGRINVHVRGPITYMHVLHLQMALYQKPSYIVFPGRGVSLDRRKKWMLIKVPPTPHATCSYLKNFNLKCGKVALSEPQWRYKKNAYIHHANISFNLLKLQVQPKSISGKSGLQNGDLILRIGEVDMQKASHEQARNEMIRAGNDVDLVVQR